MMNNFLVFLSALFFVLFRATAFSGQLNNNPNCKELLLNRREAATSVTTSLIFSSLVFGRPTCSTAAVDLSQFKNGPNGLKYLVSEAGNGSGRKPQRGTKVKTSYTLYVNGFGEDGGKKIDSSKGLFGEKPFEFDVGVQKVIKGIGDNKLDFFFNRFGKPTCSTASVDLSKFENGPKGLKYLVSEAGNGSGRKPQRGQRIKASYTLYLIGFEEDGTKISDTKGLWGNEQPFEFEVGIYKVIEGWDISFMDMEEGESRRL
eukprot:CAMPEP_0194194356 /NCGR_PEP_ID=MMETSP0154-20130528/75541_1 /TAXON_ID=1049557 /ORGANISM="Thalassiothrix antarctica, Strain L6-D1" /LENGTH=258 /DNA_ID=CAMNT_0038918783 /DNA_START=56 /DNA_END=830 /DNA_ORIENTATION=+